MAQAGGVVRREGELSSTRCWRCSEYVGARDVAWALRWKPPSRRGTVGHGALGGGEGSGVQEVPAGSSSGARQSGPVVRATSGRFSGRSARRPSRPDSATFLAAEGARSGASTSAWRLQVAQDVLACRLEVSARVARSQECQDRIEQELMNDDAGRLMLAEHRLRVGAREAHAEGPPLARPLRSAEEALQSKGQRRLPRRRQEAQQAAVRDRLGWPWIPRARGSTRRAILVDELEKRTHAPLRLQAGGGQPARGQGPGSGWP